MISTKGILFCFLWIHKLVSSLKVSRKFQVDGFLTEAVVIGPYVVSEYAGTLRYAQFNTGNVTNNTTEIDFLNNADYYISSIVPDEQQQAILVGGMSNIVYLVKFSETEKGQIIRTWKLPNALISPEILVIRKVKDKSVYLASCDNQTMAVIDSTQNNTFFKAHSQQHIEVVKELAVTSKFYMASGVQRFLVFNDWTSGEHLFQFTTMSLDGTGERHRVNGLAYIDLDTDESMLFAIGADNSKIYIFDVNQKSVVSRIPGEGTHLIDIIHLPGTSYLMINNDFQQVVQNIFDINDKKILNVGTSISGRLFQHGNEVLLPGTFGEILVLDLENNACHYSCLTCSNSITGNSCLECPPGYEPTSNSCIPKCSASGKVWTGSVCQNQCSSTQFLKFSHLCSDCHSSCQKCNFYSELSCTACNSNLLITSNGTCSGNCGFGDTTLNATHCQACPETCSSCQSSNPSICTGCRNNTYSLQNNKCVDSCDPGEYFDQKTGGCHICSDGCLECYGFHVGQCKQCIPSFLFKDGHCYYSCPLGSYEDYQTKTCKNCEGNCEECLSISHCLTCKSGLFLNSMNNRCQTHCDNNQGYYAIDDRCFQCPIGCKDCSATGCSSCLEDYRLDGGFCIRGTPRFSSFLMIFCIFFSIMGPIGIWKFMGKREQIHRTILKNTYEKAISSNSVGGGLNPQEIQQAGFTAGRMLNDNPRPPLIQDAVPIPSQQISAPVPQNPEQNINESLESEVSYQIEGDGDDDFGDIFGGGGTNKDKNPYK